MPLLPLPQHLRYTGSFCASVNPSIECKHLETLHSQGYALTVTRDGVTLAYGGEAGRFYGLATLKQLTDDADGSIPCCVIEDAPDFETRGVMLDISRDKVPTLSTIKALVDLFAQLKINQLQLYVEGYSYEYKSYKYLFPEETPLTPNEIRELDAYCREQFIELVPNQNTLGHMTAWLALPAFAALRETDEGMSIMGRTLPPSTLNPYNEDAHKLVGILTDELLECFTSGNYNAGLDEPFELGQGKSREKCEEIGTGRVYADYVRAMYDMASARGKHMMMWADIVAKHPDALDHIPKDITLLEWGYEASHPFKQRGEALAKAGFDFYFCPGTSAWTTFTGRTDNMLANIENAAVNGKTCGARGLLITDWGDGGHVNYEGVSYAAYCWGAALAWNAGSAAEVKLEAFLNKAVFMDKNHIMGGLALDAGRYNRLEDFPMVNMTLSNVMLMTGLLPKAHLHGMMSAMTSGFEAFMDADSARAFQAVVDNRRPFDYGGLMAYFTELTERLSKAHMVNPDAEILTDEYKNGLRMAELGTRMRHFIETEDTATPAERELMKSEMRELSALIQLEHRRLWAVRNKPGGLERSLAQFKRLDEALGI